MAKLTAGTVTVELNWDELTLIKKALQYHVRMEVVRERDMMVLLADLANVNP